MRFQVPQFLETETKIIGPFTLVQFLWLAGGAVVIFLLNFVLSGTWFIIPSVIVGGIAIAFAYLKIEGMSLISYVLNALSFATSSKKYLFTKQEDSDKLYGGTNQKNGEQK